MQPRAPESPTQPRSPGWERGGRRERTPEGGKQRKVGEFLLFVWWFGGRGSTPPLPPPCSAYCLVSNKEFGLLSFGCGTQPPDPPRSICSEMRIANFGDSWITNDSESHHSWDYWRPPDLFLLCHLAAELCRRTSPPSPSAVEWYWLLTLLESFGCGTRPPDPLPPHFRQTTKKVITLRQLKAIRNKKSKKR